MKKFLCLAALLGFCAMSMATEKPKNVILVIGDGMGPAYTTAYRNYMDNRDNQAIEPTVFDTLLTGMASTYSYGTLENHTDLTYVTDSAAAATAFATGVKSYNHAVALDIEEKPVQSLMEFAKAKGKTTGLVVLSQINHATPAAFVAHSTNRYNYNQIADQFFDNRVDGKLVADLMLGGGQRYFIRPERNLVKQFINQGYHYFDQYQQISNINSLPVLGLFDDVDLGYSIDDNGSNKLLTMATKAVSLMDKGDKGFFLLIESSLIDWCGHSNDIACAMHEMKDLAATVQYLKDYIDAKKDTLMVLTADHDTGGLSIGANGKYQWKPDVVRKIHHSVSYTANKILDGESIATAWATFSDLPLKDKQQSSLHKLQQEQKDWLADKAKKAPDANQTVKDKWREKARKKIEARLANLTAKASLTGWTSTAHTGVDVQVFAHGPGKAQFNGHQDNTDIAKKLFTLMK